MCGGSNTTLLAYFYKIKVTLLLVRRFFLMVPKVRIELTADPYQGPVLPLNYIGNLFITTKNIVAKP